MVTAKKADDALFKGLIADAELVDVLEVTFLGAALIVNVGVAKAYFDTAEGMLAVTGLLNPRTLPKAVKRWSRSVPYRDRMNRAVPGPDETWTALQKLLKARGGK